MLHHRQDVRTQNRRRGVEENEEELLVRVIKRTKLKRNIYGSMHDDEIARKLREGDKMTWIIRNDETEEVNEFVIDEVEPTELRF